MDTFTRAPQKFDIKNNDLSHGTHETEANPSPSDRTPFAAAVRPQLGAVSEAAVQPRLHADAPAGAMETIHANDHSAFLDSRGSVIPSTPVSESVIAKDSFDRYIIPVASTDYEGLEKVDARLVDREWRLNNLYYVINEDGQLVKFRMRPAQMELLRNMHHKNIILKARQLGFTTFICIFLLDYALFNRNKQIGIVAHTKDDATVIFRKVKAAWENFPVAIKDYFKLGTEGDSATEYKFSNGSTLRISTSLRSGTYQAVLITEFGKICAHFPEKADEIVTGTLPAVPANGLVFIESTAEGEGGHFYDYCMDAQEAKESKRPLSMKEYKFFFYPWYQNPANVLPGFIPIAPQTEEYLQKMERILKVIFTQEQRNWYQITSKELKEKMKQEHPTTAEEAFYTSGNKMFNGDALDFQLEHFARDPYTVEGDFRIYKNYIKGHLYVLGADVSQGVRRDSSTIVVIDVTAREVVLTYRSDRIDPVNFAYDIKKAAVMYGGCIAAPESNSVGMTTCVQLNQIYGNIFTQVREGMLESAPSSKLGWLTNASTKPKMMYELGEAVQDEMDDAAGLKVYDKMILQEARAYNKEDSLDTGTPTATTRHFDLLTATAIAWQVRIYATRGQAAPETVATVEARRDRVRTQGRKAYR